MKDFLAKIPAPVRAGATTAVFTFVTLFVPSLMGWLQALVDSLSNGADLPDLSTLQTAAVAAATAAATGFVNFLYRWVQTKLGFGSAPVYIENSSGKATDIGDNLGWPE